MKIEIDGTEYDFIEALRGAALGDLLKLKIKTKTPDYLGTTVASIQKAFNDLSVSAKAEGFDPVDLLGDEAFLRSIIGVIWLSKRKAGETLEISDAEATPFNTFHLIPDNDDEEGETAAAGEGVDPKALTSGAEDAAAAPAT